MTSRLVEDRASAASMAVLNKFDQQDQEIDGETEIKRHQQPAAGK
jgi:hypothetical protein